MTNDNKIRRDKEEQLPTCPRCGNQDVQPDEHFAGAVPPRFVCACGMGFAKGQEPARKSQMKLP